MTETDKVFAGAIPEIYDRFLVPICSRPTPPTWPGVLPGCSRRTFSKPRLGPAF